MSNRGPILVQTVFCPSPPVSCLLSPGFWGSQPLQIWRTACCIWLWTLGTPDLSLSLPLTVLCGSGQIIILLCASVSSIYKENTGLLTRVTGSSTLSNVVSSAGVGGLAFFLLNDDLGGQTRQKCVYAKQGWSFEARVLAPCPCVSLMTHPLHCACHLEGTPLAQH